MMFDPIQVAEEIQRSYAMNLIGIHPQAMNRLLARLGASDAPIDEKLKELVRIKGPYLQALRVPQWGLSDWRNFACNLHASLTPNGLTSELIETFEELKFKRLYRFQEEGVQAVLGDKHTLVVAGTGRGKTESWMLPIFQYVIARKRNQIQDIIAVNGTKALLIYPTKALAQDQLKRLLTYLFRLNAKLEPAAQISVGIFDGDTPHRNDSTKQAYLREAFQYFRCPIFDPHAAKCKPCGQHLAVTYDPVYPERLNLAVPRPECRPSVDLSFVRLVREDIVETCPDIVLTNPDMLNLRLLNVNGAEERRFLIEQPKFIVLDEVHTYTELFGSFTAFILRRLIQQRTEIRRQRGDMSPDPLRFIAASATVANDRDLFVRLCNLADQDIAVVREQPLYLSEPAEVEVPEILHTASLTDDALNEALCALASGQPLSPPYPQVFQLFDLQSASLPVLEEGEDIVLDAAAEQMFTVLTDNVSQTSSLNILRLLHVILTVHPMTPSELKTELVARFPALDTNAVQRLIGNFALLGARSGLLENRVHLFAWPIDGFYVCLRCGHVYDAPQGNCTTCGGNFVTKLSICRECGEEAIESWFCPHCQRLYPLQITVDGEMVYWRGFACDCTGQPTPALRVIWKPWYQCSSCGNICQRSTADLSGSEPARCEHCGEILEPIIQLPWVCRGCGRTSFTEAAPEACSCGGRTFALGGLMDIPHAVHCQECKKDFLPDPPHTESHTVTSTGALAEFKVLSTGWQVRKPSDFKHVVPCYHPHTRYDKRARYEALMRSPANTAVTSAQFALRYIAGQNEVTASLRERLRSVKMLSFSDSYNDMEQLARDFDDPERNTFVDQAIVAELEQGEQSLKALQDRLYERLQAYKEQIRSEGETLPQVYDWVRHFEGTDVRDEVTRRFIAGYYVGSGSQSPWLVREGIANVQLSPGLYSEPETLILRSLTLRNNQERSRLRTSLIADIPDFDEVLEHLRERQVIVVAIRKRHEIVSLNPERLRCFLVDAAHPIVFSKRRGRFVSNLEREVVKGNSPDDYEVSLRYDRRCDPQLPEFSYIAYRIDYTPPLLLRSAVYKGDVDKRERRRIEYGFKYGADMHFLSSGPAMEMGIDIGDLNLLLLYGTPPNINNYLQRIGRAGRRSKRSLVMSVSKRNPIDYYYYRYPLDLIISSPQPVPLNEFNEEALRISLTWALLDFIAGHYWVPWQKEQTPDGSFYTDGQNFIPTSEQQPPDVLRFLRVVFGISARDIDYGQPLQVLSVIVHDRRDEARAYLVHLLNQRVCGMCGRYLPADAEHCSDSACDGLPVLLAQRYQHLIDEVLDQFPHRMVDFLNDFRKELRQKNRALTRQRDDLEDELEGMPRTVTPLRREKQAELARLDGRLRAISILMEQLDKATLVEAQGYSTQARYAYQIRGSGDAVEIIYYSLKFGGIRAESRPSRDMGMAIKEYHPYAVILSGREPIFTRAVMFDAYKTTELRAKLENTPLSDQPLVCPSCGAMYDSAAEPQCKCGAHLVRMELQVLRRAETQSLKMALMEDPDIPGDKFYPKEVFRGGGSDKRVARTYALTDSEVVAFNPLQQFELLDNIDRPVGCLEFGNLEIVTFSDGCTVTYEDGSREPWTQRFILCGEEDCNGVIVQSRETRFCAMDPHHDVNKRRVVRLGYLFNTQGLRLRLYHEPWAVTHSLAHGFRVALEKIGGLSVRNINELLDEHQNQVYIYDAVLGGAGVTELLVRIQGGVYRGFATALEVVGRLVRECECTDGCPRCLYQYGCHNWNRPITLSRHRLWAFLLNDLRLRLVEGNVVETDTLPSPVSDISVPTMPLPLVWSAEEQVLRQRAWQLICNLEHQLRQLIEQRYQTQFGASWLDRVPDTMRTQWQRFQEQDTRAFQQYTHLTSGSLDYSYLGDLMVLIANQWQLFLDVFGQGRPAKHELQNKLGDIVKVRNPLAHNRIAPENELKRAEVYCTDVLMMIQGSVGK